MVLTISPKILGQRIKQLRTEQGMTQEDLASSDYSKSYISAIEQGKTRPSLVALQRIASRLGVPASTLLEEGGASFGAINPELMPRRVRKPRGSKAGRAGTVSLEPVKYDFQLDTAELLIYAGQTDEALGLLRPLLREDISTMSKQVLALDARRSQRAYYLAALAEVESNDASTGLSDAQRGMQIAAQQGDREGLEQLRLVVGRAYSAAGQYLSALEQYQSCLEAANSGEVRAPDFKLTVLSYIVQDSLALGDYEQASITYTDSQQLVSDLSRLDGHARLLWEAASAYSAAHQDALASQMSGRAIKAYQIHRSMSTIVKMLRLSAQVLTERDDLDEAEAQLTRSLEIASSLNMPLDKAMSLTGLARLSLSRGDNERAVGQAEEAVAICRSALEEAQTVISSSNSSTSNTSKSGGELPGRQQARSAANKVLVLSLGLLGEIATAHGENERADGAFSEALRLLEEGVKVENPGDIYHAYAQVLTARGEHERALQYLERAYEAVSRPVR